jgi:hypothetical protein
MWFLLNQPFLVLISTFPSGPYNPDSWYLRQKPLSAVCHERSPGSSNRRYCYLLCFLSMWVFPPSYHCKRPRLTFPNSRAIVGESGMYRRSEAYLGWRVLAFGHAPLHSLGMTVASVAFASATDRTMSIARFSCQPFYPIALGQNA